MSCQILVAYQCFRPVGDIIDILEPGNSGQNDSLLRWLDGGGTLETWPRKFTVIHVTDRDVSDLLYLKERPIETGIGRYHLGVPVEGTNEYNSLATTGEYSCTFSKVAEYLGDRNATG